MCGTWADKIKHAYHALFVFDKTEAGQRGEFGQKDVSGSKRGEGRGKVKQFQNLEPSKTFSKKGQKSAKQKQQEGLDERSFNDEAVQRLHAH